MKTFSTRNFRSIAGRIVTGLVFAVLISSIYAAPAIGRDDKRKDDNDRYENRDRKDNDNRGRKDDHGRYDNRGRRDDHGRYDSRGRRDDHGRYDNRGRRDGKGRYEYKGYNCYRIVRGKRVYMPCKGQERVHTPPRAVYVPPVPPGIRIFLPPFPFPFPFPH